jgi:hypothetical protein
MTLQILLKSMGGPGTGAHACNPSYAGGKDQEDCSSKSAWVKTHHKPYLEKPITKRAGEVARDRGREFKPLYCKKNN